MARSFATVVTVSLLSVVAVVAACSTSNSGDAADGGSPTSSGGASSGTPGVDGGFVPTPCTKSSDCPSGVCNVAQKLCSAPTCADGVKNEDETDIDCGGACPKCDVLAKCSVGTDCTSGVCSDKGSGLVCQPPSSTDGVKNGDETGIDCGGAGNPKCAAGQGCNVRDDCATDVCTAGLCVTPICNDNAVDGTETDVHCGGPACPRCPDLDKCMVADDCTSGVCKDTGSGLQCQPPSPTDGVKNGKETDIDCGGGDPAPACIAGKSCLAGTDCGSLGCDYTMKCAITRSCTPHYGGDTCGLGGAGGVGAQAWESCCTQAPVTPATGPGAGTAVSLGKYPVTSGRMRAFLESVDYNVRAFVQKKRDVDGTMAKIPGDAAHFVLDPSWDMYLPVSFAGNTDAAEIADCTQAGTCTLASGECPPSTTCVGATQPGVYTSIRNHLGGNIFKDNAQTLTGCFVGSPGVHSFRFPDDMQDGDKPDQDQNTYDTKTLNCVDYLVGQAFCAWDGGRLETIPEWQAAWGAGAMPWSTTSALVPVEPEDRCITGSTCTTTAQCTTTYGAGPTCQHSNCCLPVNDGSDTYWGCRFPWETDSNHPDCGLNWDTTKFTIELADYKYTYEYPKQGSGTNPSGGDYIVFLTPPGRTTGRGPGGHADVVGSGFELTSTVVWNADVFTATHRWTGNGSWEVHTYAKGGGSTTHLLNKYGKLGLRCAYP